MFAKVKGKSLNRRHSVLLGLFIVVFAAILVINLFLVGAKISDKSSDIAGLKEEIALQQDEIDELNDLLNNGSELEYIEHIARENYGYVAPGERAFYDSSAGN